MCPEVLSRGLFGHRWLQPQIPSENSVRCMWPVAAREPQIAFQLSWVVAAQDNYRGPRTITGAPGSSVSKASRHLDFFWQNILIFPVL